MEINKLKKQLIKINELNSVSVPKEKEKDNAIKIINDDNNNNDKEENKNIIIMVLYIIMIFRCHRKRRNN